MKESTKGALDRYVNHRIPPGGFLTAVLANNLKEAFAMADKENTADMKEIVQFCYWEIPGNCWGSPRAVEAWLNGGTDE